MADLLAGGAVTQEMEKLSLSVQMGFGTSSMYNKALAYEAQKVQANVERITAPMQHKYMMLNSRL